MRREGNCGRNFRAEVDNANKIDMEPSIIETSVTWEREGGGGRSRPRIVAGIPAYNEERSIFAVVLGAKEYVDEVIVCDDGSSDNTSLFAEAAGARVVRHEVNRGAGAATLTCFEEARRSNADVLVTLDGDGQHDPREIPRLVAPIETGEADVVIGSRFLGQHDAMPKHRQIGIRIIGWLLNVHSRERVSDTQSCFRGYGRRALYGLSSQITGFGFSVDLLIQSRRRGMRTREVPISCIYNAYSHTADPLTHGLSVACAALRLRLRNGREGMARVSPGSRRGGSGEAANGLQGLGSDSIKGVLE